MTSPEPAPQPSPPIAPAIEGPVAAGTRARRTAPRRKQSRVTLFVALAAALVFVPLAVWLAHQDPPRVTHAEAVTLALAIEQANTLPLLERLVHLEEAAPAYPPGMLGDAPPQGASWLAWFIDFAKSQSDYTFLDMRTDATGERTLVFRCARNGLLFDYHELRLERHDGQVKVCDLWSMGLGGWMREVWQERREIFASKELAADAVTFVQQIDVLDPEHLEAAFQKLHRSLRTSRLIGLQYLRKIGPENWLPFRVALVEFRSENPDNLAPDLLLLRPGVPGITQQEILAAFQRIHRRVGDQDFLARLRKQLLR